MKRTKKTMKLTLSTTSVRALSDSVRGGMKIGASTYPTLCQSLCKTCYSC